MAAPNRDEWLQALKDANQNPHPEDNDAITMAEFAQMIGLTRSGATQRMRTLIDQGTATVVRKYVLTQNGAYCPVAAYKLAKKSPALTRVAGKKRP